MGQGWRRVRSGVLLATGLVIGAAWIAPRLFDANQHRDVIENLASGALGRSVRIDGPVALNLLPEPSLVAARVTVGDADPQGLRITAGELRLRVGLWPLLLGHLDARDLVLSGADIHLPWLAPGGLQTIRPPEWLSGLSARIDGGQVWFGALRLTDVNAAISSDPDTGSYAIVGSVRVPAAVRAGAGAVAVPAAEWRVNARLLGRGPDGMAGVDMTLDGPGASATLAAQLGEDGSSVGQITLRGADLSQVMPAPKVPFRLVGRFSLADGLVAIDAMEGDVAGSPVRGAVSFRLAPRARLDVALAMTRLDLDGWVPVLPDWAARSVPGGLSVGLDVSAEAAPYAGGLLRGVRLAVDVDEAGTSLREARAVLPGDAEVALVGRILPANPDFADSPRFNGRLSLSAPDLRTTLAWAGPAWVPSLARLPTGVLTRATVRGDLQLAATSAKLAAMSGQIDGMGATGDVSVRAGTRPAIGVQLALDRLALDPWVAGWWSDRWPHLAELAASGSGLDLEIAVTAATASLHGQTLAPFSLDMLRAPGRLSLNRLGFETAGVQVTAAGAWLDGKRLADGKLDLRTGDLTALADAMPPLPPLVAARVLPLLRGPGSLALTAAGPVEALAAKLSADLGDLHLDAQPMLDLGKLRWQSRLALRHPGAQRLAEQLGLRQARTWFGDGSFSLATQVIGTPESVGLDYFDLGAGSLRATGQLALALGEVPALSGRIGLETLPMPLPDLWTAEPLALGWLAGWQADLAMTAARVELDPGPTLERLVARVTVNEGRLAVRDLTVEVAGGKLAGSAGLDSRADPPVWNLDATIAAALLSQPIWAAPVDVGSALVDGRLALSATGFAPAALLASLSGGADLGLREGALAGVALEDMTDDLPDDTVRAALAGGSTTFDRAALGLVIDHGVVRLGPAEMIGKAGHIDASGQIDLVSGRVDLRLGLHPAVVDSPDIGLRLTGTVDALSRAPELAELTRWHARHPVH